MSTVTSATDLNPTAASLLGFLQLGPMTGWDLDQWVANSIGNFWNVTRSQIYRELRTLAEGGYIEAGDAGRRDRVHYTITPAGRQAFGAWIGQDPGPEVIRSRLLLTVFFGDFLDRARLREIVHETRRHHEAELVRYREMQGSVGTTGFPAATLRFGVAYEEAFVEWLASLDAELGQEGPGGA
jgi:DNA-binding PadR family transcriptional regulator